MCSDKIQKTKNEKVSRSNKINDVSRKYFRLFWILVLFTVVI